MDIINVYIFVDLFFIYTIASTHVFVIGKINAKKVNKKLKLEIHLQAF